MTQVNVIDINSPFLDQKPGTSGLRKSTLKFQEEHYLEIFIEAILQSLGCLLYTSPSPRDRG